MLSLCITIKKNHKLENSSRKKEITKWEIRFNHSNDCEAS